MKKILTAIVCTAVLFAGLNASTASAASYNVENYAAVTYDSTITIDGKPYVFTGDEVHPRKHYVAYIKGKPYFEFADVDKFYKKLKLKSRDGYYSITFANGKEIKFIKGMDSGTFEVTSRGDKQISPLGMVDCKFIPFQVLIDAQNMYDLKDDGKGHFTLTTKKK